MGLADDRTPSKLGAWVLASRPKTLPAAMMPVIIGSALAYHQDLFAAGPALAALLCALLIQIGTNFSNDVLDFQAGADTEDRLGPARAVASRWINEREMLYGTVVTFALTIPPGLYLIFHAGFPVLILGLASIAAGLAYSAGPYPLASHGLGDLFVFLFFGLVATGGTYYVQTISVNGFALLGAIPAGALTTNILVINNYRDIETDQHANKHTLATRLGKAGTRIEFLLLLLISYAIPFIFLLRFNLSLWILLPLLSLPLGMRIVLQLHRGVEGTSLNETLAQTARLALIYGILFSAGLVI
ncbi:MAG TPA: 1,4-dihydroxy-2-naphthoate polyprenyltransferase [bacterium]|nr:1,4-dihydroxy-2-naphthoate polyprenyltransferase [bacterium]